MIPARYLLCVHEQFIMCTVFSLLAEVHIVLDCPLYWGVPYPAMCYALLGYLLSFEFAILCVICVVSWLKNSDAQHTHIGY